MAKKQETAGVSVTLRPSGLSELLRATIAARLPVLVVGAPGVGKSDIVAQAALAADADLILSHPSVSDPTDAKGFPFPAGDHATFLPFGELYRALKSERPTVWFLDDLGQATPAVQASFMQLLLARRVNGHILPDHVTFVAASNRRTDRAGVSGVLEPVKSRFATIAHLETSIDDWSQWALSHDVRPEVIAFLRFRPDLLHEFHPTADLVNSACPRTWSHVSKILNLNLEKAVEFPAIVGAVGEGAGAEFTAFVRIFQSITPPDAILMDPDAVGIPSEPSTLYATCTALAYRATPDNFSRVLKFANRLRNSGHGEFGVLLVRDSWRREQKIAQTRAFIEFAASDLGKLVVGKK